MILKPKTFFGIGFDIHKLVKNKKLYLGGSKYLFILDLKDIQMEM